MLTGITSVGAVALLSQPDLQIGKLWFNPDATKNTEVWEDLRALANHLHVNRKLQVSTALNTGSEHVTESERLTIEILYPDIEIAGSGPRAGSSNRKPISTNSMSAVLRVMDQGQPIVLLPADLDAQGLARLANSNRPMCAPILVFPHHGGSSGGDDGAFAERLCSIVQPDWVIFSMDRNRFRNPVPALISGMRRAVPRVRISCTQLSRRCSNHGSGFLRTVDRSHLEDRPAAGRSSYAACAGTIVVRSVGSQLQFMPDAALHQQFIMAVTQTPLCLARERDVTGEVEEPTLSLTEDSI